MRGQERVVGGVLEGGGEGVVDVEVWVGVCGWMDGVAPCGGEGVEGSFVALVMGLAQLLKLVFSLGVRRDVLVG